MDLSPLPCQEHRSRFVAPLSLAWHHGAVATQTPSAPSGARARARLELTAEIKAEARRQLAADGAAALSLRAVARDLGMASSAIYRYFPSRDDLLTALIIDAYDDLGAAVEEREATVRRSDLRGRWRAIGHGTRDWALAHPHEYSLIYGTPVPGYAAPSDTIGPASRVSVVLVGILIDLTAAGQAPAAPPLDPAVSASIAPLHDFAGGLVSEDLMLRGLAAWSGLFGTVTFELFGQFHNVVEADREYFDVAARELGAFVGIPVGGRR